MLSKLNKGSFRDAAASLVKEGVNTELIMNVYQIIGSDENKLNGIILSDMLIEQIQIKKN